MLSNLVTPPDIVNNKMHSVLLVDPEQGDLDAVIKFCQYAEQIFNVYVYTPNMDNQDWLSQAAGVSDAIVVNTRSEDFKELCLLDKTYYYGNRNYLENPRKILDPLQYFAAQINDDK